MKFKLLESIEAGLKRPHGIVYIYKNPTLEDLRDKYQSIGNRGFIAPNGDLYVEAYWSEIETEGEHRKPHSWLIHSTLLSELQSLPKAVFKNIDSLDWYKNKDYVKYGVGVQRDGDSLDFYLAESYMSFVFSSKENRELLYKMLKKAKSKNEKLNFYVENILGQFNEEDEGEEL